MRKPSKTALFNAFPKLGMLPQRSKHCSQRPQTPRTRLIQKGVLHLTMRQAAEAAAKRARDETVKAAGGLRTIADRRQIREDGNETAIVGRLHACFAREHEAAAAYQAAYRECAELQELIGGGTLGELQSEALRRRQFACTSRLAATDSSGVIA